MRAWDRWNRVRLAFLRARHRGLEIDRRASSNFAVARYNLAPAATLRVAAAAVTERIRLGTGICLVVERDPIQLAKEVASLDVRLKP